jgi:ArsR family transcriptional regulator
MKVLCESGIVIGREEGKWTHYRISGAGRDQVLDHLKVLTDASEEISDCCSCKCGK